MARRNDIKPSNVFISWTSKDKYIEQKILAHLEQNAITVCESGKGCAGDYKQWSNDAAIAPDIFLLILTKSLVDYPASLVRDEVKAWKDMLKETGDSSNRTVIVCPSLDIIKEFKDESGNLIISEEDHINCEIYNEEEGLTEENLENILNKIRNLLVHRMSDIYAKEAVEDIGINIPRLLGVDLIYSENNKAEYDDLYISRTVKFGNGLFKNSEELISNSDTDLLFITADAGIGKSCYIKQIFKENKDNDTLVLSVGCAEAANDILCNRNYYQFPSLAVFLYKRFIQTCGFENSFYTVENFITLLKNKVAEDKRVIVALDALDEIANFTRINEFISEVETLREFFNGKIKIVITDRSDINARKFTNVSIAKLESFNNYDVNAYCKKLFDFAVKTYVYKKDSNIYLSCLKEEIAFLDNDIKYNPLMLTQIILLYVVTGKIKNNEIEIFDEMTEILFKSEILKGFLGLNKIIPYNMVEILSAFAYNRHLNKISGKEWTREKAIKLFDKMYTASNIGFKNNFFGEELVNYLVYRSFFNFEKDVFCHEKYGEYLVARYYCKTVFDEDGNIINKNEYDEIISHCGELSWAFIIRAFVYKNSSIKELILPNGVSVITKGAFKDCKNIESVYIPEGVCVIDESAFEDCCSLLSVNIPSSLLYIEVKAFNNCRNLKTINIPKDSNLRGIYNFAFQDCAKLENIDLPSSLSLIGSFAFYSCCRLKSIYMPKSLSVIGDHAFTNCNLLERVIFDKECCLRVINDYVFSSCDSLKYVNLHKNGVLTGIGDGSFHSCGALSEIVIPSSVSWMGEYVFAFCFGLTIYCEVYEQPDNFDPEWNCVCMRYDCPVVWDCNKNQAAENSLKYFVRNDVRYFLSESHACVARQPDKIGEVIHLPNDIEFQGMKYKVERIDKFSFYGSDSIREIIISENIIDIGDCAFSNSNDLISVYITKNVKFIGRHAFKNCPKVVILCEAEEKPTDWAEDWNPDNRPVVWGYKGH